MLLDRGDTGEATQPVMNGGYLPTGDNLGSGSFELDGAVLGAVLPVSGVSGTLGVSHERDGSSLSVGMDLRNLQAEGLDDVLVPDQYAFTQEEAGGRLCFLASVDWMDGDGVEQLQVLARWGEDGAGRAAGALTGGDLAAPIDLAECWDEQGRATYWWDSAGLFPEAGDPATCPGEAVALPTTCDSV